jgi:hypothetical protein
MNAMAEAYRLPARMYAPDMHAASSAATVEHSTDRQEAQAKPTDKMIK